MVGRERWEEQYHRCFPIGWVATWDYHQGHQVLRQGALQCRQAQYNAAGMLGSVCRRLSGRLRQGYGPQASWSEDSWVEQILRIIPHRDEKYIRWGAQKVREEGTGPMADQVAHERKPGISPSSQTYPASYISQAAHVWISTSSLRRYRCCIWKSALRL